MDRDSREKRFWNNYLALLVDHDIKPSMYPWYVRHCERFIRANEETRLKHHSSSTVSRYLSGLVQAGDKKPWQKKQQIDALKILFQSIHAPLYRQVDWEHWKASCNDLPSDHDTHYRTSHPLHTRGIVPVTAPGAPDQQAIEDIVDRLRIAIRRKNYSIRTEKTYVDWVRRFVNFIGFNDGFTIEPNHVVTFLEHLAIERSVSPKTQSLALNSLSFLFKSVLESDLGDISHFVRPRARERIPIILTREEVNSILVELDGVHRLVISLLYGAGLRIMEAVRLRVQDIDFGYNQIIIRNGKGNKERVLPLPVKLAEPLRQHLGEVKQLHQQDLSQGNGRVYLPDRLLCKFSCADNQWVWQYVFPSYKLSVDPVSNMIRRHHINESTIQKRVRSLARQLDIEKRVTCHSFRHSYATHLLERGMDIRTIQNLLGHADVSTTMIYTHLANFSDGKTSSPLDDL